MDGNVSEMERNVLHKNNDTDGQFYKVHGVVKYMREERQNNHIM